MNKGNLFIVSGPSGTGKGTICNEFLKFDDVYLSVSVTTRDKRNDEVEGVTYIYDSVDGFRSRIDNDMMLEWAQYGDNFYGTPKDIVQQKLNAGINVILEIEVQGALKVKEKMPEAVMVFILPPSMEILRQRLINRGREEKEEIDKRIDIAMGELKKAELYDFIIVNDELSESVKSLRKIIDDRNKMMNFVNNLIEEYKNN
ncbi:MAG: guanylate kinase [Clostridia bacterium]|nr:guanylate kinase [Clostridia bacterium]